MNATGETTGAPGAWWLWWVRPAGRIAALSIVLGAVAVASTGALAARGLAIRGPTELLWLAILVVLFGLAEGFAVHIRIRRGGYAMSQSELPMVLALLTLDPAFAIISRLLGSGAGLRLLRHQHGTKLAFNISVLGAQSAVAAGVFVALRGSDPVGVRAWLATYAAMLASDVVALLLVTTAIAVHDDPSAWRGLPRALTGVPLVLITTTVGLISHQAVATSRWAVLLLGVVAVVLFLAYRAFVEQHQSQTQIRELYAFTRALDGSGGTNDLVQIVLTQARDQLRAQVAELIVPEQDGHPARRTRMSGADRLTVEPLRIEPRDAWWAPAMNGEAVLLRVTDGRDGAGPIDLPVDGMAVPVPWGAAPGVLLVTDSLADVPSFDSDGLRLFQALANHASVSLAKSTLVDRLRREAAEKEHLALHDTLTGLPNRRHFRRLLDVALAEALHDDSGPAVIQLDLDRFKEVNDALGHDTGDAILREVAARLRRSTDGHGRVARLGGDEFAVLLPRVHSVEDALAVGADLGRILERPVQLGPLSLNCRASVGVVVAPAHGDDTSTLLRRADVAMYAAKSARGAPRAYQATDDRHTPHRLALIGDLRTAIQRRDVLVVFQPKVAPCSGLVTGAEALARWHHDKHGNIPPDQFVPLAEHSGLVQPLTEHVLAEALRRCATWRAAGHDLHVAVNLSPSSLHDADLPDLVAGLLEQAAMPASTLTLEITESSIMEDEAGSMATLNRLHQLGVRLSIDDFGTGYSSLGRLRHLPIDEVKIDKSFVQRISADHRDRAVVRSAVQLGHALDLSVVAEGVEDEQAYGYLHREGCDLIQGYLISRPLPPDEFLGWLDRRSAGAPQAVPGRIG